LSGLGKAFLRLAAPLAGMRRIPLIGPCLGWAGSKIVPRDSRVWVQVQHGPATGIWLNLNPRTGRSYHAGEVEPEVQQALANHLRTGATFYDVGANIGFFSLFGAKLVGHKGRVVSFEADPDVVSRLRENAARNHDAPVKIEQKAVWSSTGLIRFARAKSAASPDLGLGHVVQPGVQTDDEIISIEAVTLDDYAAQFGPPDFIKCDVEGAEVEVFRGARRLLSENRPEILCELHGADKREGLLQDLQALGYSCEPCGANHILARHAQRSPGNK
jgi:FkbM family methyltransferase